eukprot:7204765-Alexandrium_andersonii.AAC.1
MNAFWDVPKTSLAWFYKNYVDDAGCGSSMVDLLKSLILHFFPKMADDTLLGILALRLKSQVLYSELAELQEVEEMVHEKDLKEWQATKQTIEMGKDETAAFKDDLKAWKSTFKTKSSGKKP